MHALTATVLQCLVTGLTVEGTMEWKTYSPSGSAPAARARTSAVWDKTGGGGLLIYGGRQVSGGFSNYGDLHRWDKQANSWSELTPSGTPGARQWASMVFDDVTNTIIFWGSTVADLHRYDGQANTWTPLSQTGNVPIGGMGQSMVIDSTTRTMLLFGGCSGSCRNDLFSMDLNSNAWTELSPTGAVPAARGYHSAVMNTDGRMMLVWGGTDDDDAMHGYNVATNSWSDLAPTGTGPTARKGHTAVWDDTSKVMLVFGGGSNQNDLHSYDAQSNSWSVLSPSGSVPSGRYQHVAAVDPVSGTMLVFGGWSGGNDLHALEGAFAATAPGATVTATPVATTATATTTATTTTPTTTSTLTTTTVTLAPTTTTPTWTSTETVTGDCNPGSGIIEGVCTQCPPGTFSASSLCDACADGYDSEAGSAGCLRTLSHVVPNLANPVLTTSHASSGVARLQLGLEVLPQNIFHVDRLSYAFDIAPTTGALSHQSACAAKWQVSDDQASIELNYTELSYPCVSNITVTESGLQRDAILGILLVLEDSVGQEVVFIWTQTVSLTFDLSTHAYLSGVTVMDYVSLGPQTFHVGAFSSTLQLFTSDSFATVRRTPFLLLNQAVHVEHKLIGDDPTIGMAMAMVWLSTSSNASDFGALEHNLTDTLVPHQGGERNLRYSFQAKICQSCYLHSLARITFTTEGRRLARESYTVQSLYVEVTDRFPQPLPLTDDDFPEVFPGPATAIGVSAVMALVTGLLVGLLGCQLKRSTFGGTRRQVLCVLQFCDCLTDIVVLVMVHTGEDLRFSDDGGAIFAAMSACVGLSALLLVVQVGFWARRGQWFSGEVQWKRVHIVLACTHLAVEDCFQTALYVFVMASHLIGGLGLRPSILVAMLQAVVFTVVKIAEVAGMLDIRGYTRVPDVAHNKWEKAAVAGMAAPAAVSAVAEPKVAVEEGTSAGAPMRQETTLYAL